MKRIKKVFCGILIIASISLTVMAQGVINASMIDKDGEDKGSIGPAQTLSNLGEGYPCDSDYGPCAMAN